jgi:hypothetical protein
MATGLPSEKDGIQKRARPDRSQDFPLKKKDRLIG